MDGRMARGNGERKRRKKRRGKENIIMSGPVRSIELTLGLLKPDICANPLVLHTVMSTLRARRFTVVQSRDVFWREQDAERFYAEHRGRFFFERLCGYMTRYEERNMRCIIGFDQRRKSERACLSNSDRFKALILAKENAIEDWRALMGPTHPVRSVLPSSFAMQSRYRRL